MNVVRAERTGSDSDGWIAEGPKAVVRVADWEVRGQIFVEG